ncbi:uncharacterized protein LOC135084633 isoform X1 [Ostrinia nubilalis]|uniref:uncharacterized protein LOC135084633 isoform X1 n=1 Tax=Ostrinia nubilalis TaxID=29057 RepID=UPI00308255B9
MEPSDCGLFLPNLANPIKNQPRILNFTCDMPNADGVGLNKSKKVKRECLTTNNAVKFLLEGQLKRKVCRYCLNVTSPLSELDQVLQVGGSGVLYKVTIRNMVASFYPYKVTDDPNFPNKICNKCLNQTIRSYLFTQQCERSERALRNCLEDMYNKFKKLDPLEPQKKRGRQKLIPNYNILYAEHEKVIDYAEPLINIVNSGAELTEQVIDSKFECPKCWQILPNLESLLNHEKQHPKSMWYSCRHCGKSFTSRNHLKKHVRTTHEMAKPALPLPKTDFKCAECGVVSEKYNEHLQHIEKHKFQNVMERLIEKNMDELCAVCLDVNPKLVDLEEMVCLHGGFPEMMGERTLYSIIGSTVPDKSSYKYQELLVPKQAKIVTILKVNKDKHNFVISAPIVISKDDIDFDDLYMFEFSSPINLDKNMSIIPQNKLEVSDNTQNNDFNECNNPKDTGTVTDPEKTSDKNNIGDASNENYSLRPPAYYNKSNSDKEIAENIYSFSKPEYIHETKSDTDDLVKVTEMEVILDSNSNKVINEKPCNVCWIFKNTNCEKCSKANNIIENAKPLGMKEEEVIVNKKPCQFCWVFKNCPRCDYCKNILKESLELTSGDVINKINEELEVNEERAHPKKRKLPDDLKPTAKRTKWQCQFCLSSNIDTNSCLCCDAQRYLYEDNSKVKFNFNKDFFKKLNENNDSFAVKDKNTDIIQETIDLVDVNEDIPKIENLIYNDHEKMENISTIENNFKTIDDAIEMEASPSTEYEKVVESEDMEIAEENDNISNVSIINQPVVFPTMCDWMPNEMATEKPTSTFQFNLGATTPDDRKCARRYKRPLKRSAPSFHK